MERLKVLVSSSQPQLGLQANGQQSARWGNTGAMELYASGATSLMENTGSILWQIERFAQILGQDLIAMSAT